MFLCLHTIGSHYTYSLVPYDAWAEKVCGRTLNSVFGFDRNHYDRLVHFSFGFLMAYPIRELFLRIAGAREWLGFPGLVEGGLADLVVYPDDPRADLAVVRHPSRIVLRGRVVR